MMDTEQYLLTCYRYIELNPVRAGMVKHPSEYPWSSYHSNALGKANLIMNHHEIYKCLGKDKVSREEAYRALFKYHITEKTLLEIRDATNKAWVLGNNKFREKIKKLQERQVGPKPRGGDRKSDDFVKINRV